MLNLPVIHLDGVYYDADWNTLPQDVFAAVQRDLVLTPRWLVEGNYASTLPIRLAAADTVVFLDLPAVTCLAGIVQRRLRYCGGQHTRDGVYDRLTWSFLRYIWGYRKTMRPRVQRLLAEHSGNVRLITMTSRRQADQFIAQIEAESATGSGDRGLDRALQVGPRPPDVDRVDLDDGVQLGPDRCRAEIDEVTAHERRIYRGDDDIGGVDYDSCAACQYVRLGEIGLIEVEQRRGIGTCVLAQLRAELPGYHWAITPEKRSSNPFWNHMRTTYPGEYLTGDPRVLQCPHRPR